MLVRDLIFNCAKHQNKNHTSEEACAQCMTSHFDQNQLVKVSWPGLLEYYQLTINKGFCHLVSPLCVQIYLKYAS